MVLVLATAFICECILYVYRGERYAKYGRGSVYSCIPLDGRRCWVMSRAPWKTDGHCQFDELERYMREEIEKPEKERRETENTFIDGVRAVPFTVPVGCIISSVEDLKGNSTSSDKRTVKGLAITGKAHVIRFTRAPVHTTSPSPSPASTPSPSPTPAKPNAYAHTCTCSTSTGT